MTSHDPLQQLQGLDKDSPQFYNQLSDFFCGNTYRDALPNILESENLSWFIELLDSVSPCVVIHCVGLNASIGSRRDFRPRKPCISGILARARRDLPRQGSTPKVMCTFGVSLGVRLPGDP